MKFAGFYWRIIRINGDGSLRIIYDGTQAYANGVSRTTSFIKTNTYNSASTDAKYVGWMYGPIGMTASTSKVQAQTNTSDAVIKSAVDTWYKTNIEDKGYSDAIEDSIFCNDRSTPNSNYALGYGMNTTYFGAYEREGATKSNISPTFKCSQKNDAFTVNDTSKGNGALTYPVGLITADEIVAAGSGKYGTVNTNYYLYRGSWYWSITPYVLDETYATVFIISKQMSYNKTNDSRGGLAPVINLRAEYVKTLRGTGTMTNPYQT